MSPPPAPSAKDLFDKGRELFQNEAYADAATAFREAYKLKPTWKLFYNIGHSEAAAKHHGRALEAFEAYLSEGGDDVPTERRRSVMTEIDNLRKLVGLLDIQAPDGATVYVNNTKRGKVPLPGPIPVAASVDHTVYIEVAGQRVAERLVKVMGQQTVRVVFDEAPGSGASSEGDDAAAPQGVEAETDTSEVVAEDNRGRVLRKWGFVTLGIGGALLAAGAITGGITLSKDGDLVDECKPSCTSDRQSDVNTRDALATATDVLLPTGGVAAVVGILMVTVFSKRAKKGESPTVAVRPHMGRGAGGAAVQGKKRDVLNLLNFTKQLLDAPCGLTQYFRALVHRLEGTRR